MGLWYRNALVGYQAVEYECWTRSLMPSASVSTHLRSGYVIKLMRAAEEHSRRVAEIVAGWMTGRSETHPEQHVHSSERALSSVAPM